MAPGENEFDTPALVPQLSFLLWNRNLACTFWDRSWAVLLGERDRSLCDFCHLVSTVSRVSTVRG